MHIGRTLTEFAEKIFGIRKIIVQYLTTDHGSGPMINLNQFMNVEIEGFRTTRAHKRLMVVIVQV
jgi:hypothetical protein